MDNITETILFYCVFIVSGSFHEVAHGWSAWRMGDPTARNAGRVTLNPLVHIDLIGTVIFPLINIVGGMAFLIGWMRPVPVNYANFNNPRREILIVSLAGPFANLLLAFTGALAMWAFWKAGLLEADGTGIIVSLLKNFVLINFLLAGFNLLPVPPLDGSSIVDYIRNDSYGTYHSQGMIGILLLYACIFLGFFRYLWYGALSAAAWSIIYPLGSAIILIIFTLAIVMFVRKTKPGGTPPVRFRGPLDRAWEENSDTVEARKTVERARSAVERLRRGEEISQGDKQWLEKLRRDKGDGQPLCSSLSFDVRNEFCRTCPNLNLCVLRDAEENPAGPADGPE